MQVRGNAAEGAESPDRRAQRPLSCMEAPVLERPLIQHGAVCRWKDLLQAQGQMGILPAPCKKPEHIPGPES